jgi:hypothetical protein
MKLKTNWTQILPALILAFGLAGAAHGAAPTSPQGLITGKGFFNITGTTIATLTNHAKFPDNPDALFFFPYFEWNATEDITLPPGNYADNYGGQMVGYFYPPGTGDYVFWLAADDNAVLFLSTDATPANKKLIAQESIWSNAREYTFSGGASDLTAKDSSQFAATQWPTKDVNLGGARITLQAGQPYYIEALFKEGTGGDFLSVAVLDPAFAIDPNLPIPGEFLATDRTAGPVSITTQPQSQSVPERGTVTFRVLADGTPPYSYQWKKGTEDIADATGLTYTVAGVTMADNNARFSVVVTGAEGTATSQETVLTVTPDTDLPELISAKGSPNHTEIVLTFSEPLDQTSAAALANYQVSSTTGPLNVTGATLSAGGTQVALATAPQVLGTKYTVLVSNIKDTAATPNTITASSKAVFFSTGKIVETNGFIVIEAENYDRNLDDIWVRDTTRGLPSGGASVVAPNGAGGSEGATKLEYDVEFGQAATYQVWIRASGDNGNDDSVWFHLDGDGDGVTERPYERDDGNQASMTVIQPQADFVWRSDSQDGPDPFTVDIPAPGPRVIALARREDGSFVDKIILTTDTAFSPTGFGPPETREGAPGLPTVTVTAPTAGQVFAGGANVTLSVNAAGQSGLEITRVEYTANGNAIGTVAASPFAFTWTSVPGGIYAIRATAFDEIGQAASSDSVVITVGSPPPQALLVVGTDSDPVLNASDEGIKARLESQGWQVTVVQAPASTTANGDGKQLIIISSTVNSGDVGIKFRDSTAPVLNWEQAVQDDFLMTLGTDGVDRGTLAGQTEASLVKADHPLAGGLTTGVKTMTTEAQDYSWGLPNENAVMIATVAGNPDQALIYGYDTGAILADGTTPAPGRRVMFFSGNNGFAFFTEDAVKLFDAAVEWASGIAPQGPQTGARIAWVSFHPADDTPSTAAATAGFTRAADVAYTDLLKTNGHDVTRIVTSGTPDTALLNAFDLVIISRSVPSGDYETAAETAAWNGITAPTLILGGYIIRDNRLGLMTGNNILDTAEPVILTVNEPAHPIFEGVMLDAAGTMANPFADLVSFNDIVQRGISVVTDPPTTGGTVLATDPAVGGIGGMVIGEWKAGAAVNPNAEGVTETLGGDRLVFLTGSRENDGLTANGAGIFDLSPDGAKLFLNAVNYMAGVEGGPTDRPTLSMTRTASGISLTFTGTLQSTTTIDGVWSDETAATSPFAVTPNQPAKFYRAKQ